MKEQDCPNIGPFLVKPPLKWKGVRTACFRKKKIADFPLFTCKLLFTSKGDLNRKHLQWIVPL